MDHDQWSIIFQTQQSKLTLVALQYHQVLQGVSGWSWNPCKNQGTLQAIGIFKAEKLIHLVMAGSSKEI